MKNQSFFCNWYIPFSSICCQRVNTARCLHFENRAMKKSVLHIIFPVLFIAAAAVSCSDRTTLMQLESVAAYVGEEPAQALSELDSLHQSGISGREANAKYALLYSMALDKNYIDSVDDSLINIAVAWYRHHGNADEKLKAYYYQGRIYQNAGDNESAMESFVKAEQYADKAEDITTAGLLYDAMSNVAIDIFDNASILEYCRRAESYHRKAKDGKRYSYTLLGLAIYYTIEGQYDELSSVLDSVKMFWDILDISHKDSYYQFRLAEFKETGQTQKLETGIEEYISEFPEDTVNWISVAECYLALKEPRKALEALDKYKNKNTGYRKEPAYYIHESNAYDSLGISDSALASYKMYQDITDSMDMVIFEQDTKFLRERYEKNRLITDLKYERAIIILSSIIVLLVLACTIYFLRVLVRKRESEKRKMEKEFAEFRQQYEDLKMEKIELDNLILSNPPIDRQSKRVLNDRLELLNRFFAAEISSNTSIDRKASQELSRLVEDRRNFMYTTRMTFAAAHPEFIRLLEEKGMTESEIEYCCLYAIGLKGKEIGAYIEKKRHYNESSCIRKKLGLGEHDTNLSIYLKKILHKDI